MSALYYNIVTALSSQSADRGRPVLIVSLPVHGLTLTAEDCQTQDNYGDLF